MSKEKLISLSGGAAIFAGVLRCIAALLPVSVPSFVLQLLYLCTDVFILLAVIGLYGVRYEQIARLGLAGFLLAVIGILGIRSARAFDGVDLYAPGALLFSLGLIVLGLCLRRVGALPTWVVGLWLLSFLIGIGASLVPQFNSIAISAALLFAVGFCAAGRQLRLVAQSNPS